MGKSRGQASTEYMIIVAVIIIIALIVVVTLGDIPGINKGKSVDEVSLSTQEIGILKYSVGSDETKVIIRNNEDNAIRINSLDIEYINCTSEEGLPIQLKTGEKKTITCTNINSSSSQSLSNSQKVVPGIKVTWIDDDTGSTYSYHNDAYTVTTTTTTTTLSCNAYCASLGCSSGSCSHIVYMNSCELGCVFMAPCTASGLHGCPDTWSCICN